MAAIHPLLSFFAGDTWEISGVANSADGSPIMLAPPATVEWKLADDRGNVLLDLTLAGGIAVLDAAAGEFLVTVPGQGAAAPLSGSYPTTATIPPGRYRDQCRVVDGEGVVSVQWIGFIDVKRAL